MTSTFAQAVATQPTRTTNGMKAVAASGSKCLDLFYAIGGSRGKDITGLFSAAYAENAELALRIALWARDVRGGAGERKLFRDICNWLENKGHFDALSAVIDRIPELGRADDLFVFKTPTAKEYAFTAYGNQLRAGNGLFFKWAPREKSAQRALAREFMQFFGLQPKQYRKMLAQNTNVVESQMCAKDWTNINFNHTPSVAASRYKKAFQRNATAQFTAWVAALTKNDPSAKINANAIFPYEIIKGWNGVSGIQKQHIDAQWAALPNYVGDGSVLPLVDVSGSMSCPAGSDTSVTCLDVALSLGLYLSEKNTGKFKDLVCTFSTNPQLVQLKGSVCDRLSQLNRTTWQMSTNVIAAFDLILRTAQAGNVPDSELPKTLMIFSDMQFNQCAAYDDSAMQAVRRRFEAAGYTVPAVVFWNLNYKGNAPVKMNEVGAALVSGFSPALVKTILSAGPEEFTPIGIMLKTVMADRYKV